MTKKDYELIAEVVARFYKCYPYYNGLIIELLNDLADALKMDNERFDKERFLEACNIEK